MGTRRLWIALLLAVLQYAALVRGDPCESCPELVAETCDPAPGFGCIVGSLIKKAAETGPPACLTRTCETDEFFLTDKGPIPEEIKQIKCDGNGDWVNDELTAAKVNKAICIKKISCFAKNQMKNPSCTTQMVADTTLGCEEVPFDSDADQTCKPGKTMFYKKAGEAAWKQQLVPLPCSPSLGVWVGDSDDLLPADDVLCAFRDPSSPSPQLSCEGQKHLRSDCGADASTAALCDKLPTPFADNAPVNCGAKNIFVQDSSTGSWTTKARIQCDQTTGKWMDGTNELTGTDNVVCADSDPSPRKCTADNGLSSICPTSFFTDSKCTSMAPITNDDTPLACPSSPPGLLLYFDKIGKWTAPVQNHIKCDKTTGKWMEGSTPDVMEKTNVVCAVSDPSPRKCTEKSPMKAVACAANIPDAAKCTEMHLDDDVSSLTCPSPGPNIYIKITTVVAWTELPAGNLIKCNKATGKWETGGQELAAAEIICAASVPNPATVTCPGLNNDHDSDPKLTNARCAVPIDAAFAPTCGSNKKLYFKKTGDPVFRQAESINCNGQKWDLKYKFGDLDKDGEELAANEHLICCDSNPDPELCEYGLVSNIDRSVYKSPIPQPAKSEASKKGNCGPNKNYVFATESDGFLDYDNAPVCNTDASWLNIDGKDVGKKVYCVIKNCKSCQLPPELTGIAGPYQPLREEDQLYTGECSELACPPGNTDGKFVISVESTETDYKYRYLRNGPVTCGSDGLTWTFEDNKPADKVTCSQKLYCTDPNFAQVKYCPTDVPIANCQDPTLANQGHSAPETLTCPPLTKMFIRDDKNTEGYWDEITSQIITCDVEKAQWIVAILGDAADTRRGWHHTIICTTENPQPKSTTTTTTTTEAPLPPICDVCFKALEKLELFKCDDCKTVNATDLEPTNPGGEPGLDDKCKLELKDKGWEIIVNSFQKEERLICMREGRTDGLWKTSGNTKVDKVTARKATAIGAWKTMAYVVVGGVFVAIGGMAISCVVIYMRMRKQPSSREKKKKERGVTKKYTSSNVVKTNNKSTAVATSREGTSKQGSASKMEENEDAPTLKL